MLGLQAIPFAEEPSVEAESHQISWILIGSCSHKDVIDRSSINLSIPISFYEWNDKKQAQETKRALKADQTMPLVDAVSL